MIENLFTFVRTLGNQRIEGKKFFVTQVGLLGTVSDNTGSIGTAGKVLSSTGSGVQWITVGSSNVQNLNDLTDVVINTAVEGNLLRYNGTSWVNWAPNFLTSYGSLNDLSDVTLTTPVNGSRLVYVHSTGKWVDAAPLALNKIYYGTALGDSQTSTVVTNGTRLGVGTLAMATNLTVGQVDITDGLIGNGSVHIGGVNDNDTYLLASNNKIQVGSQETEVIPGEEGGAEGQEPQTQTTFTPATLNIQPLGGQTVFGGLVTATGFKTPTGIKKQILLADGTVSSTNGATSGQILRWIESGGIGQWIADDEGVSGIPSLQDVTDVGSTTTDTITAGGFSTAGSVTAAVVTAPLIEREGVLTINSEEQVDQGEPNPNLLYVSWLGDNKFVVNADGYAIANTGFKVLGGTASGFLKANGTIDTTTYLTSYTETQTLDAVTDLGNTTSNTITVGGITAPELNYGGLLTINADSDGGLQPQQGDPAVPVLSFEWAGNQNGYIDTDGKITFNGFKTPTGTSSGFLKANGTVDTSVYITGIDYLDDIADVILNNPANGDVLMYDGGEWINAQIQTDYTSKVQHEVKAGVAIAKGQAVYVTSADGTNMIVGLASNASEATSSKTMGLALTSAAVNGKFFVVTEGLIDGLNTASATAGQPVWLGANGNLIFGLTNKPVAPAHLVYLGVVTRANANNGEIFVHVQNGFELNEIHDALITSPTVGQLLRRDSDGLWKNWTPDYITASSSDVLTNKRIELSTGITAATAIDSLDPFIGQNDIALYQDGIDKGGKINVLEETGEIVVSNHGIGYYSGLTTTEGGSRFLVTVAGNTLTGTLAEFNEALVDGDFATQSYVSTQIANLVDSAPATLNTLNELAAALGDDANFATTVATSIGLKQDKLNGVGFVKANGTTISYDNSTYITSESDPVFVGSAAYRITAEEVTSWNDAYLWGNHADAGYLTSFTELDPTVPAHVKSITTTEKSNWNTAYSWGNHAGLYVPRTWNFLESSDHGYCAYDNVCGWRKIASVRLNGNCQSLKLWGFYRDLGYTDTGRYDIEIVARAECDFLENNDSHHVYATIVATTSHGSTITDKVRVILTGESEGRREYELQFFRESWDNGYWQLQHEGGWDVWSTHQSPGSNLGQGNVHYTSKVLANEFYMAGNLVATRSWVQSQNYLTALPTHTHTIADVTGLQTALDSKLTSESDPVFVGSAAYGITNEDIISWNDAYSWGNHAEAGYLTTLPDHTHIIADVTGLQTALDGKVPTTRTITINGTAYDLSADRSWTVSTDDPTKVPIVGDIEISGMKSFTTNLSSQEDWQNSPISILERDGIGSGSASDIYSPNINFHWRNRVSRSIWMDASGGFHFGEYSATGVPSNDSVLYAGGGDSSRWNDAYSWGNHAGLYALASHSHDDRYYTETESDARFYLATNPSGYQTTSGTVANVASGETTNLNSAWTAFGTSIGNGFRVLRYNESATNKPTAQDNANWLINIYSHPTGGTASYGHQLAAANNNNIYFRSVSNGSFSDWHKFWSTNDFSSTAISNWNTAYGWGDHDGLYAALSHTHDDRYYTESESDSRFLNVSGDTMDGSLELGADAVIKKRITADGFNPVKTTSGVLAAMSDNSSGSTYYVIETNVPQDEYQMGGFTIELFGRYGDTNHKTKIDLGGYWNPESNGGFTGFEAHGTNPQYKPTIEVVRNNIGNTAFIIYGVSWSYPIIVARDLWLGYNSTDGSSYGEGWSITATNDVSSYTNRDTVVWRNAYSDSNPAGYITGYTETDTLATVTGRGNTTTTGASFGGNVGIGTTAPGYKLDVSGTAYVSDDLLVGATNATSWHRISVATGGFIAQNGGRGIGAYVDSTAAEFFAYNYSIGSYVPMDIRTSTLNIANDGGSSIIYHDGTNVGIGTTAPRQKLDVDGNISLGSWTKPGSTYVGLRRADDGSFGGGGDSGLVIESYNHASPYNGDYSQRVHLRTHLYNGGSHNVLTAYGFNVGIGTTTPTYKLHVAGNAYINETLYVNQQVTVEDNLLVTTGIATISKDLGTNDYANTGQHNMHLRLRKASLDGGCAPRALELGVLDNGTGIIQANHCGVGYNTLSLNPVSGSVLINGNTAWHAGNDGATSGLDADLLDGNHASAFALASHNHDSDYVNVSGDTMTGNFTLKYSTADSSDYNGLMFAPYSDADGLNDYIIKAASDRGVFGRKSFGWHVHSESAFGVYSNGWVQLFGVEGGTGNTQVFGNLTVSGSITESSSIRYKKDIVDIESASAKVEQLKPVKYKKIKDDQEEIGLIAEDVAELFPEVVKYDKEGRPDGVNYSRLSVILLKAVQELSQEVNELKKKLN